jgi:biotin transport system substrate-specific component
MKLTAKYITLIPFFTALTIIGAFVRIPFPLAPLTLQTLFVLLSGMVLGPVYGAVSQLLYVLTGLLGLPVFVSGGGPGYIFNPTFGFILSFIPMAYAAGILYRRFHVMVAGTAAFIICYLIGLPYLYMIFNYHLEIKKTLGDVMSGAMLVFLPGDILKTVLAAYLCVQLKKRAGWLFKE